MSIKSTRKTYAIKWTRSMCWRSLTTISRHQHDQKIMRVCISYTHFYPNKFLNHTLPSRICKTCFWNMQVASTLWPDIKSQKISERSIRLKWIKCSPRTEANPIKTSRASNFGQEEAQTSPAEGSWGWWAPRGGRPTTLVGRRPSGPYRLKPSMWQLVIGSPWRFLEEEIVAPSYKYNTRG